MAELVDALVSNTSGSNAVPVRSRLRVQEKSECESGSEEKRAGVLALALTPALFQYPEPGSNRHSIAATGV